MSKELLIKETPYDDEVRDIAREFSLSLNRARDRLIWAALQMGHTGPLVCFLLRGYVPGLAVRQHIAVMMPRQEGLPESIKEVVHYRFDINPRSGKRGPRQN